MNFSLFSIEQAPVALPIWQTILDDLGQPHPNRIAKVLCVFQAIADGVSG